jgi:cytochrome o ubiquinol oxidase operon protein cyoD
MKKNATPTTEVAHGTTSSYVAGFILSIILTITPFMVVINHLMTGWMLVFTLVGFAISQLMVQLIFFLHLGRESKPRWNILVFLFAVLVVLILVIGSLWIMNNLDYNMGGHDDVDTYLMKEEGLER